MKFLPILILVLLLVPVFVSANGCANLSVSGSSFSDACRSDDQCSKFVTANKPCSLKVCCWVITIRDWLKTIGTALAMVVIIVAGIMYMTAGGDETKLTKAKKTLTYGLIGAAIVFMSSFVVDTLNEFLG